MTFELWTMFIITAAIDAWLIIKDKRAARQTAASLPATQQRSIPLTLSGDRHV